MRSPRLAQVLSYVGANVARERARIGFTQEELAELVGIDARSLQRIERGGFSPSMGVLVALADALAVAPSFLLQPARLAKGRPGRPPGSGRPHRPKVGH